jgi:monoamine oxidase
MFFGYSGKLSDPTNSHHVISEYQKLQPEGSVKGYLSHTWSKDPYAKGAWCCAGPGYTTKSLEALQKPHGRIYMASSDWANGWRGFIDGAIEQGGRAAALVKSSLEHELSGLSARI